MKKLFGMIVLLSSFCSFANVTAESIAMSVLDKLDLSTDTTRSRTYNFSGVTGSGGGVDCTVKLQVQARGGSFNGMSLTIKSGGIFSFDNVKMNFGRSVTDVWQPVEDNTTNNSLSHFEYSESRSGYVEANRRVNIRRGSLKEDYYLLVGVTSRMTGWNKGEERCYFNH